MSTDRECITVLLADDQALVRAGFRMILETQDDIVVVGEAENGEEAASLSRALRPDVILMDIRMPVLDGLEATRQILARGGDGLLPHIVMLTTFDTDEYLYEALHIGASGFLLKTAPPDRLVDAVRRIRSNEALLAPTVTRRLIETYLDRHQPDQRYGSRIAALTSREQDVLRLMAEGLANSEIAARLTVSDATVKTHVNRILQKLQVRDRVQAVILAYESGVIQPGSNRSL